MEEKKYLESIPAEFWKIIQDAQQDNERFRKMLKNMDQKKMVSFYWTYDEIATHLRTERFLPYVDPDLSEDGVAELANWVVAQGKDYYSRIWENPELIPPEKDDVGLLSEVVEEYEQRYDNDLPANTNFWDDEWEQHGKQNPWF